MEDEKGTAKAMKSGHAASRRPRKGAAAAVGVQAAEVTAVTSSGQGKPRESRGTRRKRETRTRLLEAALALVAAKGVEHVAINEITESADVGFGSFYNHFESKDALHAALFDWVFEAFGEQLDALVSGLSDPAEVVAVSVRHTLIRAHSDPMWGNFVIKEGFSERALEDGLGRRLKRDSEAGIAAGRFAVADPFMCHVSVSGIVLAAIAAELSLVPNGRSGGERHPERDPEEERFAERAAVVVLQALGLDRNEAECVARRPLPSASRAP
ncbi:TetR family transcriptional regulator [Pandoraea eparura]|uniref:TetR family transcriptional regulator n=2 Tax=Pandoraea eparura TaxID=2508291 RepID=A0A5E4SIS5_9BURK|nr:TetR family transcriptional regulator [Pandoraea eparura]